MAKIKKEQKNKSIIALFEPCVPGNLGNIIRTCSLTNSDIILIGRIGFPVSAKKCKRSALDYGKAVNVEFMGSLDELFLFAEKSERKIYILSSKGNFMLSEATMPQDAILLFGSEVHGLPEHIIKQGFIDKALVTIPMATMNGCFNLSNSVATVLFEVWRQNKHY